MSPSVPDAISVAEALLDGMEDVAGTLASAGPPSDAEGRATDCRESHVVKRMAPTQAGAVKLAERFGDRLVCVRYRHDAAGHYRYTTVELVVAAGPIKHRSPGTARPRKLQIVAIRLAPHERDLRKLLCAHGAVWAREDNLWYISRAIVKTLDLLHRIV